MIKNRHGISAGLERIEEKYIFIIKAYGKLNDEDYKLITPVFEDIMDSLDEKINLLFDASEFEGWEPKAAWDDFKLGIKYMDKFDKIAIYKGDSWLKIGAKITDWFFPAKIKTFDSFEESIKWLKS